MKTCKFCKQNVEHRPLKEVAGTFDIYFCYPCSTEFLYVARDINEDNEVWGYSIYTYINGDLYRWTVSGLGHGHIWFIGVPGVPGEVPNTNTKLVKTIKQDPLPEVTPTNINFKIKTWLTFL